MRRLAICFALTFAASLVLADHSSTQASWGGWTVETAEELWYKPRHSSYPIWNMFDGNPRTAWVYSGSFGSESGTDELGRPQAVRSIADRYQVVIYRDRPQVLDSIQLMNGYNKDSGTFKRNARITEVEVTAVNPLFADSKLIGRFKLADSMGWHTVKLPRRKYFGLRIVVRSLVKGLEPDVAISEMKLLDRGRNVGPKKPDYVSFTAGSDCGCGTRYQLLDPNRRKLAETNSEGVAISGSADGRYFAGGIHEPNGVRMWVFDTHRGAFIVRKKLKDSSLFPYWTSDNRVLAQDPRFYHEPPDVLWEPRR
jgi:hypothetical protein